MTRPRSLLPDGPFHVICNAVDGGVLFADDVDRRRYMGLFRHAAAYQRWSVLGFVLMSTHLHVVLWTTTSRMSSGMYWLNWQYAGSFKARRPGHRGCVFGNTYKAKAITTERYLRCAQRYVALNPVKAKMAAAPGEYPWSADRLLRTGDRTLDFLDVDRALSLFGGDPRVYAAFVAGRDEPEHEEVARFAEGVPTERPELSVALSDPTDEALQIAHRRWHYSQREIATHLGISHTTVRRRIARAEA